MGRRKYTELEQKEALKRRMNKPCIRCQKTERNPKSGKCRNCKRIYERRISAENKMIDRLILAELGI